MTGKEKLEKYQEAIKLLERIKFLLLEAAHQHEKFIKNNEQSNM